jgi:apolipoprotein N-acyltransferase
MREISSRLGIVAACSSAVLLWLGLPGGGEFIVVLPVALVPLFFLSQERSPQRRFLFGLLAGFLHFVLQLYWIVIVLGRYGGLPWFFSYPAMLLLSLYMALYIAAFVYIAGCVQSRWGLGRSLWLLPLFWVGLDWFRAVLLSGFPWMDLGYALWQTPLLLQTADLFGHYFITFAIVLCNAFVFYLLQRKEKGRVFPVITVVLFFLGVVSYGHFRAMQIDRHMTTEEHALIGMVQGNIDQSRKWSPEEQQRTVDGYLAASQDLLRQPMRPELLVWPETALPFFPMNNPLMDSLRMMTREDNVALLTGSPWFEVNDAATRDINFYNSAFLLSPAGEIDGLYFKSHLVPFGEYVPLKKLLPFLAPLVEAVGDFTPGTVETPVTFGRIRCGVLICFESVFPDIARQWVKSDANVLVNLSNDAWYGRSSAPSQSMAMSVLRAVETRRSLVRAANTGISAFVDPLGYVLVSSAIFVPWAESREIPLLEKITVHSSYGYLFAPFCAFFTVAVCAALFVCRKKNC